MQNQAHNLIGPRCSCDISPRTFHFPAFVFWLHVNVQSICRDTQTPNTPFYHFERKWELLIEYPLSEDYPPDSNLSERHCIGLSVIHNGARISLPNLVHDTTSTGDNSISILRKDRHQNAISTNPQRIPGTILALIRGIS